MVLIPAGKFIMGGKKPNEQPKHEVRLSRPFAITVHEITYAEYELFCHSTAYSCPEQNWSNQDYPVVNVSWHDASAYASWLSEQTGNNYRLPSEAEWEYAARANTTTQYPFGETIDESKAVYSDRVIRIAPLPKTERSIMRNHFLLYHMVGNVAEWVMDTWHDNYRNAPVDGQAWRDADSNVHVIRGGSYKDNSEALRSAARTKLSADLSNQYVGFRVVLVLPGSE